MSDELERRFEGAVVLQKLLEESGSFVDVEDVAGAFTKAHAGGVPAQVVINALWAEEPRFDSPDKAQALFANLLGLYDLLASGAAVDLTVPVAVVRTPAVKAERPAPFEGEPNEAFVDAAARYLDDHPKERARLQHVFDNAQDALVSWLEQQGLPDAAFDLGRHLLSELSALLDVGGRPPRKVSEKAMSAKGEAAPRALVDFLRDAVIEAEAADEAPVSEAQSAALLPLLEQAAAALWRSGA